MSSANIAARASRKLMSFRLPTGKDVKWIKGISEEVGGSSEKIRLRSVPCAAMQLNRIATLIEEKLGPGSIVAVTRETETSVDLRIEWDGRTYFRTAVGEANTLFSAALADQIAASIPR